MSNYSGCPPLDVQFDVNSSVSNTIYIDFGDGLSGSNSNSVTNTYYNKGTFYPTLTITDSNNCQLSIYLDTVIVGGGDIDFEPSSEIYKAND